MELPVGGNHAATDWIGIMRMFTWPVAEDGAFEQRRGEYIMRAEKIESGVRSQILDEKRRVCREWRHRDFAEARDVMEDEVDEMIREATADARYNAPHILRTVYRSAL